VDGIAFGMPILRVQPAITSNVIYRVYPARVALGDFAENCVEPNILPGMIETCPFCQTKLFPSETKHLACYFKGKITLPEVRWPDSELIRALKKLFTNSRFVKNIRRYNALFAFTSSGTKEVKYQSRGPAAYCIRGQLTQNIGSILPQGESTEQFAQIYIVDSAQQLNIRSRMFGVDTLKPTIIELIKDVLHQHNPFVHVYQQARERLQNAEQVQIVFQANTGANSRTHNAPPASEIAVLIDGDGSVPTKGRQAL